MPYRQELDRKLSKDWSIAVTDTVCFIAEVVIVMLAIDKLPSPEAGIGFLAILPEIGRRTVKNIIKTSI